MTDKGPAAFRTISEASDEVGVASHVLRFWETKFSFIRPMKRAGGRRFYRPQDVEVLKGVRTLLHDEGYTIKGVQRLHKEGGVARVLEAGEPPVATSAAAVPPGGAGEDVAAADDGQIDLFADLPQTPVQAELTPPAARPEPPFAPQPGRYVLDVEARARLQAVLGDLEQVKAAIDGLLEGAMGR